MPASNPLTDPTGVVPGGLGRHPFFLPCRRRSCRDADTRPSVGMSVHEASRRRSTAMTSTLHDRRRGRIARHAFVRRPGSVARGVPGGRRQPDRSQAQGRRGARWPACSTRVRPKPSARYLTLHASRDDFHASIPLEAVRERAILIYRLAGDPLPASAGGPVRFFIPDFAACHTARDRRMRQREVRRPHRVLGRRRARTTARTTPSEHAELHEREGE